MNTAWRWCSPGAGISGTNRVVARKFHSSVAVFRVHSSDGCRLRHPGGSMNRRGFLLGALLLGTVGLLPRHLLAQDPQPQTPANPCAPGDGRGRRGEGGGRGPREGGGRRGEGGRGPREGGRGPRQGGQPPCDPPAPK